MERSDTIKVGFIVVALVGAGVLAVGGLTGGSDIPDDAPKVETSYWICTACNQQFEMTPDELADAEDSAEIENTGAQGTRFSTARRMYPCSACGAVKAMRCIKCPAHGEVYPGVRGDGKPGACSQCQRR